MKSAIQMFISLQHQIRPLPVMLLAGLLVIGPVRADIVSEPELPDGWVSRRWDPNAAEAIHRLPVPAGLRSSGPAEQSISASRSGIQSRAVVSFGPGGLAGQLPAADSTRIQELARGLDHNWERCFDYVRNHIAYTPYPGIQKGPERTLLDREGNDADQAFLLCALLRASGYNNATVLYMPLVGNASNLVSGFVLPLTGNNAAKTYNARKWLGVSSDGEVARELSCAQVEFVWIGNTDLALSHYWTRVTIDGQSMDLDPSFKPQPRTYPEDAATDCGYSRTAFLTAAGGTIGSNYAKGLSETGVARYLAERIAQLKSVWNQAGASPDTVLGTQSITPRFAADGRFHGKWTSETNPIDLLAAPAATLNALRTPVRLDAGGASFLDAKSTGKTNDLWFYLDEVGTRTLWFNGTSFYVDGQEWRRIPVASGQNGVDVGVKVEYTNAPTYHSYWMDIASNQVRVLGLQFGTESYNGMRKAVGAKLSKLRASGLAEGAPRLMAETLQLQAQQWFSQSSLHQQVWNRVVGARKGYFYNMGIAGQAEGPFVDMANAFGKGWGGAAIVPSSALFSSALEHSVIEQLSDGDQQAVSTVKLLALANESGKMVYFANSNSAAAVTSAISGYSTNLLAQIRANVKSGSVYLLPQNANITLNSWTGAGYITYDKISDNVSSIAMSISGGMNGGYGSTTGMVNSATYEEQSYVCHNVQDMSNGETKQADPVSMPAGAYTDQATDLTVLRAWPLSWSRNYDSRGATSNGDLGRGWSHGFEAEISETSDPDALLGSSSLEAILPTVVAAVVAEDMMSEVVGVSEGEVARRWLASALVADWWTKQLPQTCVTVQLGAQSLAFHKMPDGSYAPGTGITAELFRESNGCYTLKERHGNVYSFNSTGKLVRITDPNGNATTLTYANGKLSRIDNPFSASFTIARDSNGRISKVTDNSGKSVAYTYDAAGCLATVTDAAGSVWRYEYDSANHMMTGKKNPNGEYLIWNAYNAFGQVVTQRVANGETWRLGYAATEETWNEDPKGGRLTETFDKNSRPLSRTMRDGACETTEYEGHGHVAESTDAAGTRSTFLHDARDNLLSATIGNGSMAQTTRFGYDAEDHLIARTNALGDVTRYEYDACHRVVKTTAPDGTFVSNVWNSNGTLSEERNSDANGTIFLRTVYAYGPYGLPISRTIFGNGLPVEGIISTTEYTPDGHVAATTDPLGHRSTFSYDAAGRLVAVTDAKGNTGSYTYDLTGRLVATTDVLGRVKRTSYNASDLPVTKTNPDGSTIHIVYDELEDLLETTDERGAPTTFDRDAEGRPLAVMDALGNVSQIRYDVLGNPVWTCDASGVESWTAYDAFSRPIETRNALGATWATSFDKLNRPLEQTSPLGQVLRSEYDKVGQLIRTVRASGAKESFGYDAAGNKTSYTNSEGHVYQMSYDALGRLLAITNALGAKVSGFGYDAKGNMIRAEDGNGTVRTFAYDELDRLVAKTTPDGTSEFTYDAVGNIVSASNSTASETFVYDAMNRLSAATITIGAFSARNLWQRDAGGLVTNLVCAPGKSVSMEYDLAGRLVCVRDWLGHAWTFGWDPAGRLTSLMSPDGRTRVQTYDATGQLVSWCVQDLVGRSLEYDLAGRKTCEHLIAGAMPIPSQEFLAENVFDASDRLVSTDVVSGDGRVCSESFVYDGNDAMIRAVAETNSVSFRYDANAALTGISTDEGNESSFGYDALGNRILSGNHIWVPDQNDPLKRPLLEYDEEGNLIRVYIWAGERLLGFVDAAGVLTVVHTDEMGSIAALSELNGTILHTAQYGPHGENWGRTGLNPTPFAWLGGLGVQLLQQETFLGDLYLTRHRIYSPSQHRFLSADPLGLAGGLNLFAYGNGNPLSYIDPLGLCPEKKSKLEWLHVTLDVAGTFEPTPFCDLLNAGIYVAEGDWGNASMSLLGVIPYVGDLGKAAKYGTKGYKWYKDSKVAVAVTTDGRMVQNVQKMEMNIGKIEPWRNPGSGKVVEQSSEATTKNAKKEVGEMLSGQKNYQDLEHDQGVISHVSQKVVEDNKGRDWWRNLVDKWKFW